MKFIQTVSLLALAATQSLAPVFAQTPDTLSKIRDTGVINLGGRDASFPFSYKISADANPIGFSADLCAKVVDAIKATLNLPKLKVQYTIVTPTNRIALVQNGTVDLECSTTTNTVARAQQVDFAPTHFVAGIGAAIKKTSPIKTMEDLDGKSVATVSGSTSIQLLRAFRRNENIQFTEVSGKDTSDTFLLFSGDRAVAMVLDDVQLAGLIARSSNPGEYRLLDERLRSEPYGFMMPKGDTAFKAVVDETLTKLMKSGEINEIYAKWFTRPVPPAGVNLNYPMPNAIKEVYRNPNNRGI